MYGHSKDPLLCIMVTLAVAIGVVQSVNLVPMGYEYIHEWGYT